MKSPWHRAPLRVVLCGAQQSGKSSLFAALCRALGPPRARYLDEEGEALRYAELAPKALGTGRAVLLIDTPGLCSDIAAELTQRQAQAKTLHCLTQSDILLHVVDAAALGAFGGAVGPVDRELHEFGSTRLPPAVVIAAKADWSSSSLGISRLQRAWPQTRVVPVAVHSGRGLRELRTLLRTLGTARSKARPHTQGGHPHRF